MNKHRTHIKSGESRTRFYKIFRGIEYRCNSIKESSYEHYGGRGIKCLWTDFKSFRKDMYKSYEAHVKEFGEKDTTIERIDNNGNYYRQNCKWATWAEQRGNKNNNRLITFGGKTQHLRKWAREINISAELLWWRVKKGWTIDKVLTKKVRKWTKT